MIAEAIDTAVTFGWALAAWIAVAVLVGVVVVLTGLAVGVWAVRGLRRIAWDAWTTTDPRTDSLPPLAAEQPPSDSSPTTTPQRRTGPHEPAWARTDKEAA